MTFAGAPVEEMIPRYWPVFRLHQLGYPAVALMGKELSDAQEDLLVATLGSLRRVLQRVSS